MDFGIFILMQQRNKHKTSHEILRDAVEQTRVADELGFGGAWYAEHHFSNYGLCSSPLTMIAHCAAVTRNIRLGTGIVVAPLYQPARLIADVAMVDQLSNGRLNLGIGSGYQHFEFERFGVSLDTAKARTFEMLDMLELGLKQPKFSYDGEFYQQPMSAISQRAVQQPMPPMWITSIDPTFVTRAVRGGHHVFVSGGDGGVEKLRQTRNLIDKVALAEGKDPAQIKVGVLRAAYASDNKAEVERYLDCARFQRRIAVSLKRRTAQVADDYQVEENVVEGESSLEEMRANLPVGSVDLVIERVVKEIRTLKPCHYAFQTQMGDFDHPTMLRQLELWAKVIMPAVQREIANDPPHVAQVQPELVAA
ncbi:LLM class flavin-dependent oxidoreductase [Variovorax sp. H27-G14]|uniref:LLM class flavin-dependent oxidoreductase n=1 Tax=Variovorax sp. H27-G14 TaxID=3111914 RepID=UPI0038FD1E02